MLNNFKKDIYNNKKYLLFGYLISILTMLPQFFTSPPLSAESNHIIFLAIVLFFLFFIVKFSKILFSIFIIYINITNILIGHIALHWGYTNASIAPRIGVVAISPIQKRFEYLSTYIDYRDGLLILYSIVILVLLYNFITHFRHSFSILRFIGFLVSMLIITIVGVYKNPLKYKEPFSIPYECITANHDSKLYEMRKHYLLNINSKMKKNIATIYDKVVIIQGESVNKNHMAIYNPKKNTTPFLSSMTKKENFYIFNAISPANLTHLSIPICYTEANVHDFESKFIHSLSIISIFKQSNYKTYWISNQGQAGKSDTNIASIAHEANIQYYENMDYMNEKPNEILLSYLNKVKSQTEKEMYFIHLMGSHSKYEKRYTSHSFFKNPKNIEEQYDNSIYYTDNITKKIFSHFLDKFSHKSILFIYLSDHGEVISKEKHGHGFIPPYKDEYEIPLVIYSNIKNDRLKNLSQKNKTNHFNLENLYYIIQYITGVSPNENISYMNDIIAVDPKNIFNYTKLNYYRSIKK